MISLTSLDIKIFADGADLDVIRKLYANPLIRGFTTNPTLMNKAGITDYEAFGRSVLAAVPDRPVSLEVFADDFGAMIAQAQTIASWGRNANVKIPVSNTSGEFTGPVIKVLAEAGVVINVTAVMTIEQVDAVAACLDPHVSAIVSVFAGRVADTGRDPVPHMIRCRDILKRLPKAELLWASPRELLNIFQADEIGCHIITVTNDVLKKVTLIGKDLHDYSLETVQMFHDDAAHSGYTLRSEE